MNVHVPADTPVGCLVANRWMETETTLAVVDPSTGVEVGRIAAGGAAEIDAAVAAARTAADAGEWSRLAAVDRGRLLTQLAAAIAANAGTLAPMEAGDTGKPLAQARADIAATARYFEFYGGAADKVHGETIPYLAGYAVQTLREPHGVTGHIIPWNYPSQMFGRTLAPALAMGNATVLKPAEEACLTPLAIARLAVEVGFPPGAINVVPGRGEAAGAALAAHPGIDFLSFTGSPEVGVAVQSAAARNHVGCTLELGGKSPQIVFADADLEKALPALARAIVQNGGQTCSAGSRALVERRIFDEVAARLAERFSRLVAAPAMADRDLGPLISKRQKARVEGFLARTHVPVLARGTVAAEAPEGGFYAAPVLLGPADPDTEIACEEVFGPVLTMIPFDDEADAIRIANATPYGLVAGIWSADGARQMRLAKAVRAGQVFLNAYGAGGGIELPFGGTGRSGHGRENGFAALHEFSQLKTVVLDHG